MTPNRYQQTVAYVRIHETDDFCRCGWVPTSALEGTGHGRWSVLMEWVDCDCKKDMPWPRKVND